MDLSFAAVAIISAALAFDFVNGFHDAANSIATVVSTRVLSPRIAVGWAAFWNFAAFLAFGTAVADTIGKGTIDIEQVATLDVILGGLVGAIAWDLITWYYGLPSSSSHALVGGLAGAAVMHGGWDTIIASGFTKIAIFIIVSPLVGVVLGVIFMNILLFVAQKVTASGVATLQQAHRFFRRTQLLSAAAFSLGHGANDAQKTMGVIAAIILIDRQLPIQEFQVDLWMVLSAHAAIGLGTLFGGWRIVHTLGSRLTKLEPVGGASAETAAAATLFTTASLGIPVSTTHTITGAIIGVGATNRMSAIRWGLTGKVLYAWVLTIPGAFAIAAASYLVLALIPADVVVPVGFLAAASWAVLLRRRQREARALFAPPG